TAGADPFLAGLGALPVRDGLPIAGGTLTLDVPHPLIARRTWLWRAGNGEVIEALGFAPAGLAMEPSPPGEAGRRWLAGFAAGPVHEDTIGPRPDGPSLCWAGPRAFATDKADQLRQAARFAAAPHDVIASRATPVPA